MPITWGVVSSSICREFNLFVMEEVGEFLDQWCGHKIDIADVTNFVLPGSPLDEEASQRGTSVYMVERRIDMLPKPLTEGIIITHFHKVEIKLSVKELCLQGLFKCILTSCCFVQIFVLYERTLRDLPSLSFGYVLLRNVLRLCAVECASYQQMQFV